MKLYQSLVLMQFRSWIAVPLSSAQQLFHGHLFNSFRWIRKNWFKHFKFPDNKIVQVLFCYCSKYDVNQNYDILYYHCVKSICIQSFSVPYSVQMRETANQKNSEYGHLSRNVLYLFYFKSMQWKVGKHNQSKSIPSPSSHLFTPFPLYIVANHKTSNSMK